MTDLRICLIYFSATHVTMQYAAYIREELLKLGCEARLIDVTSYSQRQGSLPLDLYDACIFG